MRTRESSNTVALGARSIRRREQNAVAFNMDCGGPPPLSQREPQQKRSAHATTVNFCAITSPSFIHLAVTHVRYHSRSHDQTHLRHAQTSLHSKRTAQRGPLECSAMT